MRPGRKFAIPGWRHAAAALLLCLSVSNAIADVDPFVVRDMRVEGLQRISEGTVFNYLPINIGDTIDGRRIREAIRALYDTNFFQDIEMRRDRDTLAGDLDATEVGCDTCDAASDPSDAF